MILIVVKHPVREQYADRWPELVEPFTRATRAEPGNISFEWSRSVDDPNLYVLVEAFVDSEAGRAHVESEHFKAAIAQLPGWLAAAPEIIHVETSATGWSQMREIQPDAEG